MKIGSGKMLNVASAPDKKKQEITIHTDKRGERGKKRSLKRGQIEACY